MNIVGQWDILDYLIENKGKEFTSKQLSEQINCNMASIQISLKKLRERGTIHYKKVFGDTSFRYWV